MKKQKKKTAEKIELNLSTLYTQLSLSQRPSAVRPSPN